MTEKEYKEYLSIIDTEYSTKKKELQKNFAVSNNPFKEGDVVCDKIGAMRIEKIQWTVSFKTGLPTCVYFGVELKKDGSPIKKQTGRAVYQINILYQYNAPNQD